MLARGTPLPCNEGPSSPGRSHDDRHPFAHHCSTQGYETGPGSSTALQIGSSGFISIYAADTTIPYFIDLHSFPTEADARHVADSFWKATQAWNLDHVRFTRVFIQDAAFFSVIHFVGAPGDKTLAEAFFPNSPVESRVVKVYDRAFLFPEAMVNIFCHELGHVLGLRHEFAAQREMHNPSVCFGYPNPESVMNYFNHPLEMAVHWLDIELTNRLYECRVTSFLGFPIVVVSLSP
ncbi:hypothetical protein CEP53_015154 [Fusarium sp. AF-6]|nr:hypothetical protein CEP53_015154 [Fusarium sp. AF-6]